MGSGTRYGTTVDSLREFYELLVALCAGLNYDGRRVKKCSDKRTELQYNSM